MRTLIISGLGFLLVALIAMPAAAEKGSRQRGEGYHGGRVSQSYSHNDHNRGAYKRDLNRERREYQRDMKQNARAMKRADSPRERARIRHNMRADWRDYKHDALQIRHNYHHQQYPYHHRPVIKHHPNSHNDYYYHHSGYQRGPGASYLAFGLWF